MDFYHTDEETPLLKSITVQSSPHEDPNHRSELIFSEEPQADVAGMTDTDRLRHMQTEVELSLDKVSFIYSPKSDGFTTFHGPSRSYQDAELSVLDPYFDVTISRLRVIFDNAHPDETDCITYEGFKQAIEGIGIRCCDDAAFLKLVGSIDRQASHRVSFPQFDAAVHKLKLVHLFEKNTIARMVPTNYRSAIITVTDFSSARFQQYRLTEEDLFAFFTSNRPSWVTVRWINMNGPDGLNLKRFAIKYRLHPLAIEDTLEMHERPKFDLYEGHIFLVFPVLRMESIYEKNVNMAKVRQKSRSKSLSSLFRLDSTTSPKAGPIPLNRGDSFTNPQKVDDNEDPFKIWIEHVAIFIVGNCTLITVKDGDSTNIWDELNHRLTIPYSKLRHNDAKFLLYAVLDVIVDQVTTVMDSITEILITLEDELDTLRQRFDITKLRCLKNELFRLPRLLKPAREVLRYLIESKDFDEVVTAYIRDVHDHMVQILDDIELQLQMCRLLTEGYRDQKSNQMNYVIYTLTIVTTVFLPAQFLTGVYGMNFTNMPELHMKYGYLMFWILVLGIAASLQVYFRHKRWI
ncbi:unnamed protein product [Albugo candida]|uniref:Magnesium and cobalt transporter CorA n=1 Tax=Albugo candida TaxID=65357 RepID=A0A024GS70_9STRA|nr:unnamed protein product [Albugo candida]|eukprot:CCI49768.1 unnamed protein product [Albugo candida]